MVLDTRLVGRSRTRNLGMPAYPQRILAGRSFGRLLTVGLRGRAFATWSLSLVMRTRAGNTKPVVSA